MTTKYQKLYEELKSKIEKVEYKPESLLPSEMELKDIYNTSRDTVRKALSLLESQGYINKVKGKGSVVMNIGKYDFPVTGLISFTEMMKKIGAKSKTKVVEFKKSYPSENERNILSLEVKDEIITVKRVRTINDEKVILDVDILVEKNARGLTREIAKGSIFNYIENVLKEKISMARKEIYVVKVTKEDKKYLDLKGYDFLVVVDTLVYLNDGSLLQHTYSKHRPDKFKFIDIAKR